MELTELGKKPISESEPAGQNVRFEPDYEALSQEIEKLSSPTASGGVDWNKVAELSKKILSEQSKDLLVACYLSVAMLHTQKLKGLALGVSIIKDMLENFWDNMFPPKKRIRGRVNAIVWWKERLEASLSNIEPESWPPDERSRFIEDLKGIDSFLGENMEDAPMLNTLIEKVQGLLTEEQIEEQEPQPKKEEPSLDKEIKKEDIKKEEEASPVSPPIASVAEDQEQDPERVLEAGLELLGRASTLLSAQNPFDPMVFRLNRISAWLSVDSLPMADGGRTMLPPPDSQIISSLNALYDSGNWKVLLETSESYVPQFLFWLDLSRYSAEALEQLGYSSASEIIANETREYVKRLAGIEKLSFSDGTPFADESTREWLRELMQKDEKGTAISESQGDSIEQNVIKELEEAKKKIKENRLAEALVSIKKHIDASVSMRERFLWQLGVCELLLKAKKTSLAIPYIENTLSAIDQYRIEEWEPELAVKALQICLRGLRIHKKKENQKLIEDIIKRISILNPVKAMELI